MDLRHNKYIEMMKDWKTLVYCKEVMIKRQYNIIQEIK